MSTAAKTSPAQLTDAPIIAPAGAVPELIDDPATNEEASAGWAKSVVIGVIVGIPVLTALLTAALVVFTATPANGAFWISFWVALWLGVFAGGTAGSVVYELRHGD